MYILTYPNHELVKDLTMPLLAAWKSDALLFLRPSPKTGQLFEKPSSEAASCSGKAE